MEDHSYDELRYMCMERPIKSKKQKEAVVKPYNPLDDTEYSIGAHYEYYRRRT